MAIKVVCSHCGSTIKAPDTSVGKVVTCPRCRQSFLASSPAIVEPLVERRRRDEDEYDQEQHKPRRSALLTATSLISLVVWCVLFLAVCFGLAIFFSTMGKATSAVQECSIAATISTMVVSAYVIVRSVGKVLGAVESFVRTRAGE